MKKLSRLDYFDGGLVAAHFESYTDRPHRWGVGLNSAAADNPVNSRTGVPRDTVPTRQRLCDLESKGLSVAVIAPRPLVAVSELTPSKPNWAE